MIDGIKGDGRKKKEGGRRGGPNLPPIVTFCCVNPCLDWRQEKKSGH